MAIDHIGAPTTSAKGVIYVIFPVEQTGEVMGTNHRALLAQVAQAHRAELEGDLDRARFELSRAEADAQRWRREVDWIEALLGMAGPGPDAPRSMTLHDAMVQVLASAPVGMMRAGDLAAEINRLGLYRMRDGRPVEIQQIHARVNNYGHLFAKEGTFIKLARTT
jgi:hypothetical protein